jgi:nicotinamidase-related amidase
MSRGTLIVIDVQNEYFDGALPITDPSPDESLANIGRAMDGAHAAGIPIIVVQHADEDADAPMFRKGSEAWKLRPEVEQRPRTHLIEKALPGAFTGTPLDSILAAEGIELVTIAGYMTHMCVDTTARQAVHLGYTAEILSDATGTLSLENTGGKATGEELHRATLVAQGQFLSEVVTTDAWLRGLLNG